MIPRAVRGTSMRSAVETPRHARYDRSMETPMDPPPQRPSESAVGGGALAEREAPAGRFRLANLRRSDRILGGCAAVLLVSGLLLQGYGAMRGVSSGGFAGTGGPPQGLPSAYSERVGMARKCAMHGDHRSVSILLLDSVKVAIACRARLRQAHRQPAGPGHPGVRAGLSEPGRKSPEP